MKPTSRKRRPPDTRDSDRDGRILSGSNQPEASRKRPKAAQRNGSDPDGVFAKTETPEQAPTKPISDSHCILTPLTDIPASKKRSRVASHKDAQVEPFIEKPRKRMKAMLAEDQPATTTREKKTIKSSSGQVEQGDYERKALNLASRKQKENTLTAAGEAARQLKDTKSSKPPSKPRGPPASVLKRVKQPLPMIEDDDPDPINFLL